MTRNKKVKFILILAILILAIFFAVVTSKVVIMKSNNLTIAEMEKFTRNIKFSKQSKREPYMEFNGKIENNGTLLVLDNGKEIVFETPLFEMVGDKAVIHYWITNENGESARIGNLVCKKTLIVNEDFTEIKKEQGTISEENKSEDETTSEESKSNSNENIEDYILITSKNELKDTTLSGGETTTSDGTIEIELLKPYAGLKEKLTYRITCSIEATREQ